MYVCMYACAKYTAGQFVDIDNRLSLSDIHLSMCMHILINQFFSLCCLTHLAEPVRHLARSLPTLSYVGGTVFDPCIRV